MSEPGQKSVLARKADHVRMRGPKKSVKMDFGTTPLKALNRSLKHAGVPYKTLAPEPRDESVLWDQSLAEVTDMLGEGGLLVILEGEERARGLLYLQQPLLDALIEVQTTGEVDKTEGTVRKATAIDAALARDFIDLALSSLDTELEDASMGNVVMRMHFGTVLDDRKQLPLLVPERGFHVFRAVVDLAQGAKVGQIMLALPGFQTAAASWPKRGPDPQWRTAFHRTLSQARVSFETVLFRREISLKSALNLAPGSIIPFDSEMLGAVRVEDRLSRMILRGRLGQASGNRALRLTLGAFEVSDDHAAGAAGGGGFAGASIAAGAGAPAVAEQSPDLGALSPPGDLEPAGDGGLPPLGGDDGGLPPLGGDDGGLPPLGGDDGGLPPLGGDDGGLPPLGGDGGLPPLGGLPDLPGS